MIYFGSAEYSNNSSGMILVLDDEYDIATMIKRSLEVNGFKNVSAFTDPILALEHFRNNSDNYSLILSDVRMPGMNGFELVLKVRASSPTIKVLLMSAFEISDFDSDILPALKIDDFLQKPISIMELIAKI